MRILVTGNMGYVGAALVRILRQEYPCADLIGYDTGFFGHNLTAAQRVPESYLSRQIMGDVRDFPASLLDTVDGVIHLAAISNDPMGQEFERITHQVNREASVRLAQLSAARGVKSFVFASSCSVYGAATGLPRRETDPVNPLTAYARSKIGTEEELRRGNLGEMVFTSLRFATACGMSERLRLDLVLNDFVASAIAAGEITVLSDGTPWRPLIDVADMARALLWALQRPVSQGGKWLAINAGSSQSNYQVRDLALAVQRHLPGTRVSINTAAPPDGRSYQVDFSLFESLAKGYLPQENLNTSIQRLIEGLGRMGFSDREFRSSPYIRLRTLRGHRVQGHVDADLRWIRG